MHRVLSGQPVPVLELPEATVVEEQPVAAARQPALVH